ncbi:MAG: hypothetical protein ACYC2O_08965 [Microthrixaceae bacterium]
MQHPRTGRPAGPVFGSILLIAVVAVIAPVVGCSGDDSPGRRPSAAATSDVAPIPLEQWQQELEADCAEINASYTRLATAQPATPEEAVDHATQVDRFVGELDDAIAGAGRPGGREDDAASLVDAIGDLSAAAGALRGAAAARDAESAASAAARIASDGQRVNELAAGLGVPACGGF